MFRKAQHYRVTRFSSLLLGLLSSLFIAQPTLAESDIQADGSVGTNVIPFPLTPNPAGAYDYGIRGGTSQGQNLFHSFDTFNITSGDSVYFLVPSAAIANIFARVTGATPSNIDGFLGTLLDGSFTPSTANLFLINPYGILFGPNAQLDLDGSFVATTADTLRFGNAGTFSALNQDLPSPLLTVNPSAFLFTQILPGQIESQSNAFAGFNYLGDLATGLRVFDGKSLVLLGDAIKITAADLNAFGGYIDLGSVSGTGAVGLSVSGNALKLNFSDAADRGDITVETSSLSTIGPSTGGIALHARDITLDHQSGLFTGIVFGGLNSQAGDILLDATGQLMVANSSVVASAIFSAGSRAGNINASAQTINLLKGGSVLTVSFGDGSSGNITLQATDTIRMAGKSDSGDLSGLVSTVLDLPNSAAGGGNEQIGNITVQAPNVILADSAQIGASSLATNVSAGNIFVAANQHLSLTGQDTAIQSFTGGVRNAGNIEIQAGTIEARDGASITTNSDSSGNAGSVRLTIDNAAIFEGVAANGFAAGIYTSTQGIEGGQGGNLNLSAGSLTVANGAQLSAATYGSGDAGNINLDVRGTVLFDGIGSGAYTTAEAGSQGDGGTITINANQVSIRNSGLSATSLGSGRAGNISLNSQGNFLLDGGDLRTVAFASSGGNITIAAKAIRMFNDSNIATSVFSGVGGGGDILMQAGSILAFADSDILAFSIDGRGGNVTLATPAFFGENFRPAPRGTNPILLEGNGRVDVNASGAISSGAIALPDVSFIQNSLTELPDGLVNPDQLVAGSCIARATAQGRGSLVVTGTDSLPTQPGASLPAAFATGTIQTLPSGNARAWQPGDAIAEPTGVYQLADGRLVMSRTCDAN